MTNEEIEIIKIVFQSYLNIVKIFKKPNYISEEVITEVRDKLINELEQTRWIPVSEGLPQLDEEACSDSVLVSLKATTWDISKCRMVHITKIAYYDEYAISSDGRYMDTEGWVLADRRTLSMNEVIAWMPLPQPYKVESEDKE